MHVTWPHVSQQPGTLTRQKSELFFRTPALPHPPLAPDRPFSATLRRARQNENRAVPPHALRARPRVEEVIAHFQSGFISGAVPPRRVPSPSSSLRNISPS
ncbi:unnamed protein product [Boreogadus saida]